MKQSIKIGVVCLARKTFDFQAAQGIYGKLQTKLERIDKIEWCFKKNLIIEIEDAKKAALELKEKHIDALIVISGTFALGHLVLELNKVLSKPLLLWGLYELPFDGGKIRLNSVCGVNLNASNLYKANVKNFHLNIGDEIDEDWLDAIRIKKAFSEARVGLVGYRAKGFFNLDIDELNLYNEIGVLLDHFELDDIYSQEASTKAVNTRVKDITTIFHTTSLSKDKIRKLAELVVKIDLFIQRNNLTTVAIRCWPEFAKSFGISPCAAMSILQSEGKIIACEGDVLGGLTMLAQQAIGAKTPFLADFSQIDFRDNFALLWHCGVAPCNLWDGKCERSLDTYFAGGKGITADFVMKEGDLSISRIDYALGEYRIYLQEAKAIPMEKELKGTYMKAIFEGNIQDVLETIVYNGIAHHLSVSYGSFLEPFRIFAKLMNWKIIE